MLALALRAGARWILPPVARVYIPEPQPDPARDAEFGLVELADGGCGLYYAWLGASQRGMSRRFDADSFCGVEALQLAALYSSEDEAERSLGLAAINAITASVWQQGGFVPPTAQSSFGFEVRPHDHLGMVGNFPSLVRQAQARGARVTVLERKAHMVRRAPNLEITLDPLALRDCRKVLITAATLINDTLDGVLDSLAGDAKVTIVGPTAGCFPDPLFARGVQAIGGTLVMDPAAAYARLVCGAKLEDSARRFLMASSATPTFAELLTITPRA